jgi:hypothetical protein
MITFPPGRHAHLQLDRVLIAQDSASFGLKDAKGRKIGYLWTVYAVTTQLSTGSDECWHYSLPFTDTTHYYIWTSPTRNGRRFGAIPTDIRAVTLEGAMAQLEKRREGARKRYAAQKGVVAA